MLNETKGSGGMFSRAGKISSGFNIILAKKDEIVNNQGKSKVVLEGKKNVGSIGDIRKVCQMCNFFNRRKLN